MSKLLHRPRLRILRIEGLVVVMLLMVGRANAQKYPAANNEPLTYFVLIQADDGQPFYVRLDDRLYSSSPGGHLILSQLKDSVYMITVGFPGEIFPEQRYLLNIRRKDWSLRLSRQDNQWGLYDKQGQPAATVAGPTATEKLLLSGTKKDDAFSQLMSSIVQDTAVMYNTYAAPTDSTQATATVTASTTVKNSTNSAITTDTATAAHSAATDSLAATSATGSPTTTTTTGPSTTPPVPATTTVPAATSAPAATNAPATSALAATTTPKLRDSSIHRAAPTDSIFIPSSPTGVVKLSERKSNQSLSIVYTDHQTDKTPDTIDVVIPVDSPAAVRHIQSPDTPSSAPVHAPRTDTPAVPATPATNSAAAPATNSAAAPATTHKSNLPFINSDCHASATDYDVDKLRIRMLNVNKDNDRIQTAYKVFKTKCFTTKQIRALSEVFTTDAAKYKFLETAYPFVSDSHFSELLSLLSDPVYIEKFRNMVDHL